MASIATNNIMKKNIVVIYCRKSRISDPSRGIMSMDSQKHAMEEYINKNEIGGIYSVLQSVGSAYSQPQTDLLQLLRGCKKKILCVFEPNRLSRNLHNLKKIKDICVKNKHKIVIVTLNKMFDLSKICDYEMLYKLIDVARKESADMGARISRTYRYKKSREAPWGKMRNELDEIVDNPAEIKVSRLIKLLGTARSSISEISILIGALGNGTPFELEEYGREGNNVLNSDLLPYPMSMANIADTLRIWGIRKRKARWTTSDISAVLDSNSFIASPAPSVDDLCEDFEMVLNPRERVEEVAVSVPQEWISIWYTPDFVLPPNVRLPEGMSLPSNACMLYIPKI